MTPLGLLTVLLAARAASAHNLGNTLGIMNHSHDDPGFGGGQMERTPLYADIPMGSEALHQAGWVKADYCDPAVGHMWTQEGGPTKKHPFVLYTTRAGQPSGVGVKIYNGNLPPSQQQWATIDENGFSLITVAFRKGDILCSGSRSDMALGDTLIVNPSFASNPSGHASKELALTESGAEDEGWHRGSCFDGMGWHYFLDTQEGHNRMSWEAKNLFPVVPMYHEGQINGIVFASWVVQQTFLPPSTHQWDQIPMPNPLMCNVFCDSDCHFKGTETWSTLHVYFRDHSLVTCDPSLKCFVKGFACCPSSVVV